MVLVATWRAASRWAEVSFVAPRSPAPRREGSAPPRPGMGNSPHVAWAQACGRILKPRMQAFRNCVWRMGRRGGFAWRGRWAGRAWKRTGWRRGMGDGRGNLRENREDPAPTVGRWRGCHCDPIVTPLPQPCAYHAPRMPPPMGTLRFLHNDAARRAATVFEKWNCLIETYLHVRESPQKMNPCGPFAAVSLLEYGGLKPILPFPRRT